MQQDSPDSTQPNRILRRREVARITGLSLTTIWRLSRSGNFPKALKLSAGCVGWRQADVDRWLAELNADRAPSADREHRFEEASRA